MSSIPEKFKIDFSRYKRDMVAKAIRRVLSQHKASPVYLQFIAALVRVGPQWLYDENIKQQEANTLYMAEGFNLDAIGRIVGQPRTAFRYDESRWMFADRPGQGADQAFVWVENAPLFSNEPAGDAEYRRMILLRILCNFTRFASLPELAYFVRYAFNEDVSWSRVGPMTVDLYVRSGIARWKLEYLIRRKNTTEADDIYMFPYPATLHFRDAVFVPPKPFIADRGDGHQADAGSVAVARAITN